MFSEDPGVPLVYFDARRKVQLLGHVPGQSQTFGHIAGGSTLMLEGSNFAPLGPLLRCVFMTPGRQAGNDTVHETDVVASYISPTRLACESPNYAVLGTTFLFLNNSFNTSLYSAPPDSQQVVNFTYYDKTQPPAIYRIEPTYAAISGRRLRFVGGLGPWGQWEGTQVTGGLLLMGSNFAPTNFLWCAFGMPPEFYTTSRGPWRWTRGVYLSPTEIRCDVPEGFLGEFPVAASTDDVQFSSETQTLTYYDPSQPAYVAPGQRLALAESESGFLKVDPDPVNDGGVLIDDSKAQVTLLGSNFVNITTPRRLLCRFGTAPTRREPQFIPPNNTDPFLELDNVVEATFLSSGAMRCRTPRRAPGSVVPIFLSIGGIHNFSTTFAELTYYEKSPQRTIVSSIVPSYGPIRAGTLIVATGVNFAPTVDAAGGSILRCVIAPQPNPDGWASLRYLLPATFINYNTVLCNLTAQTYSSSGDAMLGVLYDARVGAYGSTQVGPMFTLYDPALGVTVVNEGTAGQQPGFDGVAYGIEEVPSNVTLTVRNVAPTPSTRCQFHLRTVDAEAGLPPLHETDATVLSATRVRCELPPARMGDVYSVHVSTNDPTRGHVPAGASVTRLAYYDARIPPTVLAAAGAASGGLQSDAKVAEAWAASLGFTRIDQAGSSLIVRGRNFAPTGEASLRCLYTSADASEAQEQREQRAPLPASWNAPLLDEEGVGAVAVAATYVDSTTVRCPVPQSSGAGPLRAGDARLRISHSSGRAGAAVWSNSSALIALYDASAPAETYSVNPPYGDRAQELLLSVRVRNAAPTGAGELTCRFGTRAGELRSNATYISSDLVRCPSPWGNVSAVIDEVVQLRVSHSAAEEAYAAGWVPLKYIDSSVPPVVSTVSPDFGSIHEPTLVHLTASNVAPVGASLRCRFGNAPLTKGGWRGNSTVACIAPPGFYQTVLPPAAGSEAFAGVGGVSAMLSIAGDDLSLLSGNTSSAAFTYYDPHALPYVEGISSPLRSSTAALSPLGGGELVHVHGSNFAGTPKLRCSFGDAMTDATFRSPSLIACRSPSAAAAGAIQVHVRAATQNGSDAVSPWSRTDVELTYFDTSQPPAIGAVRPAFASLSGGAILEIDGSNFAPTAGLACWFGRPSSLMYTMDAARVQATFVNATRLQCAAPPLAAIPRHQEGLDMELVVRLEDSGQAGNGLPFSYYDPGLPPSIDTISPAFADRQAGGSLMLTGENFAPTASSFCLYALHPLAEVGDVALNFSSESSVSVATPATFLTTTSARCPLPTCDSEACLSTLYVLASHSGLHSNPAAGGWSTRFARFTFYESGEPPLLRGFGPEAMPGAGSFADSRSSHNLTLHGSNFAPTGGALRCSFGAAGEVVATFVNASVVECASPTPNAGRPINETGGVIGTVALRVTTSGGVTNASANWSAAAFNVTFYDGAIPPVVDTFSPRYAHATEAVQLEVVGANYAPLGAAQLRCVFGDLDVPADFVSDRAVRCTLPPAPSGTHGPLVVVSHNLTGASMGTLTYYDRDTLPTVHRISPSFGGLDADPAFGYIVEGANFAPTGGLRCRFGFDASGDTAAVFVRPDAIACQRPAFAFAADVPVVASHDGGGNFSSTAARFTYYNQSRPPSLSALAPPYGPSAGGGRITITGANFAPHPLLHCRVGGMHAAASFDSSRLVSCRVPPSPNASADAGIELSLDGTDGGLATLDGVLFTYFDETRRPTVSSIEPRYGHIGGGVGVLVSGSNFIPAAEGLLQCLWDLDLRTNATFVSHAAVRCAVPPRLTAIGDVHLDVLSNGEEGEPSFPSDDAAGLFTAYDASQPATAARVVPQACDSRRHACVLTVSGSNFAPTDALTCRFAGLLARPNASTAPTSAPQLPTHAVLPPNATRLHAFSNATFVSAHTVRCAAPRLGTDAVAGDYDVQVTHDGAFDGHATHLTLYDEGLPAALTAVSPLFVHPLGGTVLTLSGSNIASAGRSLICEFRSTDEPALALSVPASFGAFWSARCEVRTRPRLCCAGLCGAGSPKPPLALP